MTSPISERLQFLLETAGSGAVVGDLQRIGAAGETSQTRIQQQVKGTETAFVNQGRAGGTALAAVADGASKSTTMLGRMSERLGVTESTLRTGIATGAAVGFGVLVAKAGQAINSYVDLAGQVRNFQRASGASAEESSRFVAVLDDLQISAEAGSAAIGKLARADPAKLEAFGIEVARTRDGTVSLTETLLNAADAYAATEDPQQRALLGNAAFGKSYQTLIPLLEQGRTGLESYFEGVNAGQIYTQEALDQARAYELALDDLQDTAADFGQAFGQTVVPALTKVIEAGAGVLSFFQNLPGPIQSFGTSMALAGAAGLGLNRVLSGLATREGQVGRLAGAMSSFGRFGTVGVAIGAGLPIYGALDDAITDLIDGNTVTDIDRMALSLTTLGKTGGSSGAFADQGGLKDFVDALQALDDQGDLNSSGFMDDLNGLVTLDFSDAHEQFATMDAALASLVENGNADAAALAVARLQAAAIDAGFTAEDVAALLPSYAGALEDSGLAGEAAAEGTEGFAAAAATAAEQADVYSEAMNRLKDAIDEASGRQISLAEADIAARDALADFNTQVHEAVAANGEQALSLDRNTQAGRDNQSALLDMITAAQDLATATAEQTGSTEAGRQAFQTQIGTIRDNMIALGFNEDQVNGLIATYGRVPSTVPTTTIVRDEATGKLVAITNSMDALDGKVATLTVRQIFTIVKDDRIPLHAFDTPGRATGGAVQRGSDYIVGEVRPELFRPAVPGTIVPNTGASGATTAGRSGPLVHIENASIRDERDIYALADELRWALPAVAG